MAITEMPARGYFRNRRFFTRLMSSTSELVSDVRAHFLAADIRQQLLDLAPAQPGELSHAEPPVPASNPREALVANLIAMR